jgi:hypothetical protein
MRIIEQMGSALRRATRRFAEGAPAAESIDATNDAIAIAVDVPPELFLRMSPQSMVSLLEISNADDRLIEMLAEALLFQADVYETEALLIEAGVRREQAAAMLEFIDPARAN